MTLKKQILKKIETPRIKSISTHPLKQIALVTLYTGTLHIISTTSLTILHTIHVCDCPIRTSVFLEHTDQFVIGTDEGKLILYNLNLKKEKEVNAHEDFVRKVISPAPTYILSCSDDTLIKMFTPQLSLLSTFSGHKHFVMDICIYPKNTTKFISSSLDNTIKIWSIGSVSTSNRYDSRDTTSTNPNINTLTYHTNGVNTHTFIHAGNYLISSSDDLITQIIDFTTLTPLYSFNTSTPLTLIREYKNRPLFITLSENGEYSFYNNKTFKLEQSVNLRMGRLWDVGFKDDKIIVGSDQGIVFIRTGGECVYVRKCNMRVYSIINQVVSIMKINSGEGVSSVREGVSSMSIKDSKDNECITDKYMENKLLNANTTKDKEINTLNNTKEISTLEFFPSEFCISVSGKLMCIVNVDEYHIYSCMGFRNRGGGKGNNFKFLSDSSYLVREGDCICFYDNKEKVCVLDVGKYNSVLYVDRDVCICTVEGSGGDVDSRGSNTIANTDATVWVSCRDGVEVCRFPWLVEKCVVSGGRVYMYGGGVLRVYGCSNVGDLVEQGVVGVNYEEIMEELGVGEMSGVDGFYCEGESIFITSGSGVYLVDVYGGKVNFIWVGNFNGIFVGVDKEVMVSYDGGVKVCVVDWWFVEYKRGVLRGEFGVVKSGRESEVVVFLESVGCYEQALELVGDNDKKFELLILLGRLGEAEEVCSNFLGYCRLGMEFMRVKKYEKARKYFMLGKEWSNAYLCDVFCEKSFKEEIGVEAEKEGIHNLAFLCFYGDGKYEKCSEMLKGTEYYDMFKGSYC